MCIITQRWFVITEIIPNYCILSLDFLCSCLFEMRTYNYFIIDIDTDIGVHNDESIERTIGRKQRVFNFHIYLCIETYKLVKNY